MTVMMTLTQKTYSTKTPVIHARQYTKHVNADADDVFSCSSFSLFSAVTGADENLAPATQIHDNELLQNEPVRCIKKNSCNGEKGNELSINSTKY